MDTQGPSLLGRLLVSSVPWSLSSLSPRLTAPSTLAANSLFPLPLTPAPASQLPCCRREGGDRESSRSGEALLTFPHGVQAVKQEPVNGAAAGAVVQRGRAPPSGQHSRELSRRERH